LIVYVCCVSTIAARVARARPIKAFILTVDCLVVEKSGRVVKF
jgi:hypothetical protein